MFEKELPARPNLDQYKKQAKELANDCWSGDRDAAERFHRNHPRYHSMTEQELLSARPSLTDAQLVLAREHGFESWPKFARHIETQRLIESVEAITDPVAAFLEFACVPRHTGHGSGTLEHAEMILARYPHVAESNVWTASVLGREQPVRNFIASDSKNATAQGPNEWDALTCLCFSRYLRIQKERSAEFVETARALLDAGASASTGWYETIDHPKPRQTLESALYGAAAVAQQPELTKLLLERGADPNADEETCYHVPENYDNTVLTLLLESKRVNERGLYIMLVRKADVHDEDGMRMVLEAGGNPNIQPLFGVTPLHQAIRRDNSLSTITLLIDHGADPNIIGNSIARSAASIAARRGRNDVLAMLEEHNLPPGLEGVDRLIAACAKGDRASIETLVAHEPHLTKELLAEGGSLLSEFAGNGNVEGMRCLFELGVAVDALYGGDGYFDIARNSTALHVAAWKAKHAAVKELVARGASINSLDGKDRTPLALAVRACVNSYWTYRRRPDSVRVLLEAGASTSGINLPTGYDEIDNLLACA